METCIVTEDRAPEWDSFVLEHPDSVAWQSYGWSDVLRKHYDVVFYPIAACEEGRIRGIAPIYHVRSSARRHALVSVPFAVAGGIAADNASAVSLLVDAIGKLRREYGGCCATLKQYKVKVGGDLVVDTNYYNRELSLNEDLDRVYRSFADANKVAIGLAEKQDLRIVHPFDAVESFYEVLLGHHLRKGIPCPSKKWISGLVECGMYSLAVVTSRDQPVAGTMVKRFKKTFSFPYTCAATSKHEESVPYWLYWQLIKKFAGDGAEIFHSGRIPKNDDTDAYRLGWGGQAYSYYYQYLSDAAVYTEYTAKRGRKRDIIQNVWKHLPRPVAKALGPRIVRRFP